MVGRLFVSPEVQQYYDLRANEVAIKMANVDENEAKRMSMALASLKVRLNKHCIHGLSLNEILHKEWQREISLQAQANGVALTFKNQAAFGS